MASCSSASAHRIYACICIFWSHRHLYRFLLQDGATATSAATSVQHDLHPYSSECVGFHLVLQVATLCPMPCVFSRPHLTACLRWPPTNHETTKPSSSSHAGSVSETRSARAGARGARRGACAEGGGGGGDGAGAAVVGMQGYIPGVTDMGPDPSCAARPRSLEAHAPPTQHLLHSRKPRVGNTHSSCPGMCACRHRMLHLFKRAASMASSVRKNEYWLFARRLWARLWARESKARR